VNKGFNRLTRGKNSNKRQATSDKPEAKPSNKHQAASGKLAAAKPTANREPGTAKGSNKHQATSNKLAAAKPTENHFQNPFPVSSFRLPDRERVSPFPAKPATSYKQQASVVRQK
jgi:hypothetical protein